MLSTVLVRELAYTEIFEFPEHLNRRVSVNKIRSDSTKIF